MAFHANARIVCYVRYSKRIHIHVRTHISIRAVEREHTNFNFIEKKFPPEKITSFHTVAFIRILFSFYEFKFVQV